jgi:hypothetical protein
MYIHVVLQDKGIQSRAKVVLKSTPCHVRIAHSILLAYCDYKGRKGNKSSGFHTA